jgi:hypothetical protein
MNIESFLEDVKGLLREDSPWKFLFELRDLNRRYNDRLQGTPEGVYLHALTLRAGDLNVALGGNPELKLIQGRIVTDDPDRQLDQLELSARLVGSLRRSGIKYLGELVQFSEEELLDLRDIGETSLKEVRIKLKSMGYSLDMDIGYERPDKQAQD